MRQATRADTLGYWAKEEKKEGSETLEAAAKPTAEEIAKELKSIFQRQGWI